MQHGPARQWILLGKRTLELKDETVYRIGVLRAITLWAAAATRIKRCAIILFFDLTRGMLIWFTIILSHRSTNPNGNQKKRSCDHIHVSGGTLSGTLLSKKTLHRWIIDEFLVRVTVFWCQYCAKFNKNVKQHHDWSKIIEINQNTHQKSVIFLNQDWIDYLSYFS